MWADDVVRSCRGLNPELEAAFDAAHAEASRHFGPERERDHVLRCRQARPWAAQDPLKSLIVPRPIGWISTVDRQGRVNLAPYSFYNAVSEFPPMVYFAITGTYGDTPTKHSRMNAEVTGEFVVNMVSEPRGADERHHDHGGVRRRRVEARRPHARALHHVKPPRVKNRRWRWNASTGAPSSCRSRRATRAKRGSVVFGQVVGVHIDDGIIKDGRIDTLAFRPVARLGYSEYTTTDNVWRMRRPDDPRYQ